MSNEKYPYVNHMNILYGPLQLIDIQSLVDRCTDQWYNQTLCQVNDSVVRLGILHGELIIDLEGSDSVELYPHQGYVVPKGIVHKTRAPEKTVVLMIETAGIV